MKKKISLLFVLLALTVSNVLIAQIVVKNNSQSGFEIVGMQNKTKIFYDKNDAKVVETVAKLLADDIELVTNKRLEVKQATSSLVANSIVIGTIGHNRLIDQWISEGKIDVKSIKGKWEAFHVQMLSNPTKGVDKVLVVVGSDRRGTAYGTFQISEAIGISPWYWWLDAPIVKQDRLNVEVNSFSSEEPSVKYRGLFINDEDWGLLRWAKHTFEPEVGNIGPKTYAKVCELLLRLKGNYLAPAMHEASTAFNQIAENKVVADNYGIVMGSVHCEPLLFNNASEWDKKTMGEWDYINNKDGINNVLKKRVEENAQYENVYTLALRGLHDKAMTGSNVMSARVEQLNGALMDQRQIVADVLGKPANEIPQAFTPYKEVLDVYNAGLNLPEDVTIVWPDDNYGYMKRLSSPAEQQRSGRSGVYYHVSYLGKPHDYLWIASTPPALMYEELKKAYDTTADRLWLLNVGDIKSAEFPLDLFLSMAYDIDQFNYENIASYQAEWLQNMFGEKYYNDFLNITTSYYNLAFARKPEFMGWGYQWSTYKHGKERNTDTDFSFANYGEADRRIAEYDRLGKAVTQIMNSLTDEQKPAFFQALYYPVRGSEFVNKMVLNGQKNRWYAQQKRASTNTLKEEVKVYYDSLQVITDNYNSLLDGKWKHIMTTKQGFAAAYFEMPKLDSLSLENKPSLGVMAQGEDVLHGVQSFHALPSFSKYTKSSYHFDVYNKGEQPLEWELSTKDRWIRVDKTKGKTKTEDRISVSIDWDKVPVGDKVLSEISIKSKNNENETILVSVYNPSLPTLEEVKGLFIQDNGYISIPAADYHNIRENDDVKMKLIHNLGYEGKAVQLGDPMKPMQKVGSAIVPALMYDFYALDHGSVDVYTYVLPTFPVSSDKGYAGHESSNIETKYGVSIDDGPVMTPTTSSFEYAQAWFESALKNCRINKTTLHINKPGKHTLNIITGDPGTVVQKIVIDFGGLKRSYLGPTSTQVK